MAVIKALTVELGLFEYGRLLDDLDHARQAYRKAQAEYHEVACSRSEIQANLDSCKYSVMQLEAQADPGFGAKVLIMERDNEQMALYIHALKLPGLKPPCIYRYDPLNYPPFGNIEIPNPPELKFTCKYKYDPLDDIEIPE